MQYHAKSPGVYVPETATPPSTVPEVTISRLMLIGSLPWTDSNKTWSCDSWRDVLNTAQKYFQSPGSGQAIVRNLQENLRWEGFKPISQLKKDLEKAASKMLAAPGSSDASSAPALTEQSGSGTRSAKKSTGLATSDPNVPTGSSQDVKPTDSGLTPPDSMLGAFALTLHALKTYFEHGGGSVVVFHPANDLEPGDALDEDLLRKHDIGILCAPGQQKTFYDNLRDRPQIR